MLFRGNPQLKLSLQFLNPPSQAKLIGSFDTKLFFLFLPSLITSLTQERVSNHFCLTETLVNSCKWFSNLICLLCHFFLAPLVITTTTFCARFFISLSFQNPEAQSLSAMPLTHVLFAFCSIWYSASNLVLYSLHLVFLQRSQKTFGFIFFLWSMLSRDLPFFSGLDFFKSINGQIILRRVFLSSKRRSEKVHFFQWSWSISQTFF